MTEEVYPWMYPWMYPCLCSQCHKERIAVPEDDCHRKQGDPPLCIICWWATVSEDGQTFGETKQQWPDAYTVSDMIQNRDWESIEIAGERAKRGESK